MDNRYLFSFLLSFVVLVAACNNEKHFITDKKYLSEVEDAFKAKQDALPYGELFGIFDTADLTLEEREAVTFLYAFMPIGDITDYEGEFYLKNIRSSFQAREEMSWGKRIPEGIFRHFVLPVRVNNENMDESRMIFFEELKGRVKGLSLYDAVLEVNHWCHEKVIYTPSDSRTSSPLASVKTAYGRCGEESTFTVAALRAVGIPARQVYTPRWAHTDDNHAWVEAWVDGKWMFLGACEPEPVLNLGWFNEPASRGMLMHTKVFGKYYGPGEVMEYTDAYTEINVIDNYAPTAEAFITVVDAAGQPVEDAMVEFKIYNYAEFYTVATKKTSEDGLAFLTAGHGDMLIWATKEGRFGYTKVSFGKEKDVKITLDKQPGDIADFPLDIVPPAVSAEIVEITPEQRADNDRRLKEEDEIRNVYVATFYTEEKAELLARELGIDRQRTIDYMIGSRGNWREIENFLRNTPVEKRQTAMDLLRVISAKDLRDTPAVVLADHLNNSRQTGDNLFLNYVLNPRISSEFLTPYKRFFLDNFDTALADKIRENPELLVEWTKKYVTINNSLNPQCIPIMPIGVWKARVADTDSRNVFFIALARTLGIPARIEPVAQSVQYYKGDKWVDIDFEAGQEIVARKGKVITSYSSVKVTDDPLYWSHFTVAKILPDGRLQTLSLYGENTNVDMGGGDTWSSLLKQPLDFDEGNYMMVTGTRLASGSVLSHITFFNVEVGKTTNLELIIRDSEEDISVIGIFNSEDRYQLAGSEEETSVLLTTERGGLLGSQQEPTNHAMRDIAAVKQQLDEWGRSMILLFPNEQEYARFDSREFGDLPNTITYGIDMNGEIQAEIVENMKLRNPNSLPIFIIADTFNRVVFVSQGYTIGLGEQLMKVIHKL